MASNDHFTAATLVFPCTKPASDEADVLPDLADTLEAPDFAATGQNPTPDGLRAAALLKQWAYGSEAAAYPLVHAMLKGTLEQAEACVAACTAALLDCVAPSTCLSLLALAERCGCGPLYCVSLRCALDNFVEAVREDAAGLRLLSSTQMARLLSSDTLAVASEYEAFEGLAAWVEADAVNRLAPPSGAFKQPSAFAALLQNSVRLGNCTYEELERMDQAPLTARDKKAIGVVAMAVIMAVNGVEDVNGERPRQARGAAPQHGPWLPAALETGTLQIEKVAMKRAAAAVDDAVTDMLVSPSRPMKAVSGGDMVLPTQRALFGGSLIDN
jgi:hypothetical protein